jgi:RHS repeat-associated protein
VNYTFDDNGNLLNDGTNTYTYDSANRLTAISGQQSASYQYNGLGDRYTQTVNNQITTYVLDLNAGLTQVLMDNENTYVYGLGRISQTNTSTEYFLSDALGSVRQLTNSTGEITLAKSYNPYGVVTQTAGSGDSIYAYTGEQTDSTGLTYLRARYYNSNDGRFTSRDIYTGNSQNPITFNKWQYAYSNPINLTDPSGNDPWWCENQNNPDLCYANWGGGNITSGVLKTYYDRSPNEALLLLQNHFNILLPPGIVFRFARYGVGVMQIENTIAEGFTPFLWVERNINRTLSGYIEEGDVCQIISTTIPETLVRFDNSVYIFDTAFTNYNFHPDDVASIMIHEGVHAWQEEIAINQQLLNSNFNGEDFLRKYQNGLERQAYKTELSLNGSRLSLSSQRVNTVNSRLRNYNTGIDSPIILSAGMP